MRPDRRLVMSGTLCEQLHHLWKMDSQGWPALAQNIESLHQATYRLFEVDQHKVELQLNPARERNVAAPVNNGQADDRPCPLCHEQLPEDQNAIAYGRDWLFLCNLSPLLEPHFTVISSTHRPQRVHVAMETMLSLVRDLDGAFTVLYNGPCCGASIPEHMHLQATPAGALPFERELAFGLCGGRGSRGESWIDWVTRSPVLIGTTRPGRRPAFVLVGEEHDRVAVALGRVLSLLGEIEPSSPEPMLNMFASYAEDRWLVWGFPRARHRPLCYGTGENDYLITPGAIDLCGRLIAPRASDFDRVDQEMITRIYHDVLLPPERFAAFHDLLAKRLGG